MPIFFLSLLCTLTIALNATSPLLDKAIKHNQSTLQWEDEEWPNEELSEFFCAMH